MTAESDAAKKSLSACFQSIDRSVIVWFARLILVLCQIHASLRSRTCAKTQLVHINARHKLMTYLECVGFQDLPSSLPAACERVVAVDLECEDAR